MWRDVKTIVPESEPMGCVSATGPFIFLIYYNQAAISAKKYHMNMFASEINGVTALCSEGPMFRRFYVQKIFVQKVLCSEGSIFRRSYVQKVLCSEGPIFRRSYVQKVLCSENICSERPIFRRFYV